MSSNINQSGGKIIGSGEYGCVFKPALRCVGQPTPMKNTVSKFMDTYDAYDEMDELTKVDTIDPDNIFHLPKPTHCRVAKPNSTERKFLRTCSIFNKQGAMTNPNWRNKYSLLQMVDGGQSFRQLVKTVKQTVKQTEMSYDAIVRILNSMIPLFYGLVQMHASSFCHCDIKLDNIMFNSDTYISKYIDFGLSGNIQDIYKKKFLTTGFYYVLPSELIFLHYYSRFRKDPSKFNMSKIMQKLHSYCKFRYNTGYLKKFDETYMDKTTSVYTPVYSMNAMLHYEKLARASTQAEFNYLLSEKIDTFSLGIVLVQLWKSLTGTKFNRNIDVISELSFDSDHKKKQALFTRLHNIILGMIHPYYGTRSSPQKAYDKFKKLFSSVKSVKHRTPKVKSTHKRTSRKKVTLHMSPSATRKRGTSIRVRKCPEGKILNPKTGRFINKHGVTAKKLLLNTTVKKALRAHVRSSTTRKVKVCPPNKVLNPFTNRCVNRTGVTAKRLGLH